MNMEPVPQRTQGKRKTPGLEIGHALLDMIGSGSKGKGMNATSDAMDKVTEPRANRQVALHLLTSSAERAQLLEAALGALPGLVHCKSHVIGKPQDANLIDFKAPGERGARRLVLCDSAQPAHELLPLAKHILKKHPKEKLVLIAPPADTGAIEQILRAGVRGYIPNNFRREAMLAALEVVLASQRYMPFAAAGDTAAPRLPEKSQPTSGRLRSQADQPLTPAELDVCRLVAAHHSDREIAEIRGVERGTVRIQVTTLLKKLNCKRRDEAGEIYRRLHDMDDNAVQRALQGETLNLDWLLAFMTPEQEKKGKELFRRGDSAKKLYYIVSGEVQLPQIGAVMRAGELFGEIGIFAPDHRRMHTAVCTTDVELRTLETSQVWRYYQLKPQFAVQVLCLITRRLLADINRLRG